MPGSRPGGRILRLVAVATALGVLLLSGLAAPLDSGAVERRAATPIEQATTIFQLGDNLTVHTTVVSTAYSLLDRVVPVEVRPAIRSYQLILTASAPLSTVKVALKTNAMFDWTGATQMPGGADYLPPLSDWTWSVTVGKVNDTRNWTATPAGVLSRSVSWRSTTFEVTGIPRLSAAIVVNTSKHDGTHAPGVGFQLSNFPQNDTDYTAMASALDPYILRLTQLYQAPASWSSSSRSFSFDLTPLQPLMQFSTSTHARVLLSLPAGTWGDGNTMPTGVPLNTSLLVDWVGHGTGYFPTTSVYSSYVATLARELKAANYTIAYWNIGNEVPVTNNSEAAAFSILFNAAATAVHSVFPGARVGADVMLVKSRIPTFASMMRGEGFIAFHAYPAEGLCNPVNSFCVPDNLGNYNRNAQVLQKTADFSGFAAFESPRVAQWAWYNATGKWLPIVEAETNLNSGQANGTDPRQQTLFGAAWLADSLIQGAIENVSSEVIHSYESYVPLPASATSSYGGWGFGLTSEWGNDNDIRFAPYWTVKLWSTTIVPRAPGLAVTNTQRAYVEAYSVKTTNTVTVYLVNLVGTKTNLTISVNGGTWFPSKLYRLDSSTYRESFNPTTQTMQLHSSGISVENASGWSKTVRLGINGYGVDVLVYSTTAQPIFGNQSSFTPRTPGASDLDLLPLTSPGGISPSAVALGTANAGSSVLVASSTVTPMLGKFVARWA